MHNSRRVCTDKSHWNYVPKIMFSIFISPPPLRKHAHKFESAVKRLHNNVQQEHHVGNETGCL